MFTLHNLMNKLLINSKRLRLNLGSKNTDLKMAEKIRLFVELLANFLGFERETILIIVLPCVKSRNFSFVELLNM